MDAGGSFLIGRPPKRPRWGRFDPTVRDDAQDDAKKDLKKRLEQLLRKIREARAWRVRRDAAAEIRKLIRKSKLPPKVVQDLIEDLLAELEKLQRQSPDWAESQHTLKTALEDAKSSKVWLVAAVGDYESDIKSMRKALVVCDWVEFQRRVKRLDAALDHINNMEPPPWKGSAAWTAKQDIHLAIASATNYLLSQLDATQMSNAAAFSAVAKLAGIRKLKVANEQGGYRARIDKAARPGSGLARSQLQMNITNGRGHLAWMLQPDSPQTATLSFIPSQPGKSRTMAIMSHGQKLLDSGVTEIFAFGGLDDGLATENKEMMGK